MKSYYLFLLSAVLLWNIVDSDKGKGKITISQYPFMVQINSKGERVCEGTIISSDWILTAAHCIEKVKARDLSVRYGTILSETGGFSVGVVKKVQHPKHNCKTMANDVALLQLAKKLNFAHNKRPIKLARRGSAFEEGANATLIGWGIDQKDKDPTKYLDTVDIAMVNGTACIKSNETEELPEGMICAGQPDGDENICVAGQGGAPLIIEKIQVGIAVTQKDCDSFLFASISHRVIRDFIRQHAGV